VTFKKDIKSLSNDANIFVKNIPNSVSAMDFENFFNQFGEVFSSKLNTFEDSTKGYGYVQFESKESVDKVLEQQKTSNFPAFFKFNLNLTPFLFKPNKYILLLILRKIINQRKRS